MRSRLLSGVSAAVLCALLGACGGGGGDSETLEVDFGYNPSAANIQVWTASSVAPSISGLDGHAPHCRLSAGSLPAGVTLDSSSCVISGTPQETGAFPFTVTLTASNATGSVDAQSIYTVPPLALTYANFYMVWGQHIGPLTPSIAGYTPQAGDAINFAYDPPIPGEIDHRSFYQLDAATGVLSGTPVGDPNGGFPGLAVYATITRAGHQVTALFQYLQTDDSYRPDVEFPVHGVQVPIGTPFSVVPTAPPFAALGFAVTYALNPQGMNSCQFTPTVDPATGAISGTMAQNLGGCFVSIKFTATNSTSTITGGATALFD